MQDTDCRRPNTSASLPSNLRMRNTERHSFHRLLKEELRMTIMAKRHARGEADVKVEFPEPESHELTFSELERRERRREQNRRAAQRCRKKKRMNQMSVLQNYEWIITRNQQLQLEVDQLRQDKTHLQSLLQNHRNACTCTRAPKALTHSLNKQPVVKAEPREESATISGRCYGTPPPVVSQASWQYGSGHSGSAPENGTVSTTQPQQHQQGYGSVQSRDYPFVPYSGASFPVTSCSASSNNCSNLTSLSNDHQRLPMTRESSSIQGTFVQSRGEYNGHDLMNSVCTPVSSSPGRTGQHHLPTSMATGGHVGLLQELACMSGGVSSCAFQEEAATPLSADGRRSISSISSDLSAASEHPGNDVNMTTSKVPTPLVIGDYCSTDDVAPSDISHLLSQINQTDLLFPSDGSLDDVFSESVAAMNSSLPEHFLQSI